MSLDAVRDADAGLLRVVPKGWLFQVIVVSTHDAVTRKTSYVRHALATADGTIRSTAEPTVAEAGMAGLHFIRSNWR
jgi:hypothetical protein